MPRPDPSFTLAAALLLIGCAAPAERVAAPAERAAPVSAVARAAPQLPRGFTDQPALFTYGPTRWRGGRCITYRLRVDGVVEQWDCDARSGRLRFIEARALDPSTLATLRALHAQALDPRASACPELEAWGHFDASDASDLAALPFGVAPGPSTSDAPPSPSFGPAPGPLTSDAPVSDEAASDLQRFDSPLLPRATFIDTQGRVVDLERCASGPTRAALDFIKAFIGALGA